MYQKHVPISIVIAVKNRKTQLEETILSVVHCPKSDIELIVIDGDSNDGTIGVIRKYESVITYWKSEPDSCLYDAYNKGWEAANNKSYVLFLGAGDRLIALPDDIHPKYGARIIYGSVDIGKKRLFVSRVSKMSRFANTLHHQALLVPKAVHPDPPFDTKYKVYADFDFNQRLIKSGASFEFCEKFISYAQPGGISENYSKESFLIAYKNFGFLHGFLAYLFFLYQKCKRFMHLSVST